MLASPLLCGLLSTGGVPIHLPVLCLSLQGVKASPPRATGKKKITQLGCCQPSPVCQKREIKANKTSKGKIPKPPFGTQQLSKKTQGPQERGEPTPNENHSCCRCELHRQSRSQGVPGSLTTLAGTRSAGPSPASFTLLLFRGLLRFSCFLLYAIRGNHSTDLLPNSRPRGPISDG